MNGSANYFAFTEEYFLKLGSTWALDSFYLFVISPMAFIGFFLNILCAIVNFQIKIAQTKLYKYLTIYSLNSSFISLILGFIFLSRSPRYLVNGDYFGFYRCRIFGYAMIALLFFSNIMEIFIIIDRLSIFFKKFELLRKLNPYILSSITLTSCFIITLPLIISYYPNNIEIISASNISAVCVPNEFGKTQIGIIVNLILIIFRDIITLIIEIVLSVLATFYFKKFMKKRSVFSCVHNFTQIPNNTATAIGKGEICRERFDNRKTIVQKNYKNLQLMTITISILSIISHILVALGYVLFVNLFSKSIILNYFVCLATFSVVLKHYLNFFIFYKFNSNFKKYFKKNLIIL